MAKGKDRGNQLLFLGEQRAFAGGAIAMAVAIGGQLLVGRVYGWEARNILNEALPTIRSLGSSVITASATILALMLTLLSFGRKATKKLEVEFFKRVKHIGLMNVVALAVSLILLLFLSVPLPESANVSGAALEVLYYSLVFVTAAISGIMIAVVLMLYNAIESLVTLVRPDKNY